MLGSERAAAALRCEAAEAALQNAGGLPLGDPHSEAERGLYVRRSRFGTRPSQGMGVLGLLSAPERTTQQENFQHGRW